MEDRPKIYPIPDNYVAESRIFGGLFRTRYFIEGCIFAGICLVPCLSIPFQSASLKISFFITVAIIPFGIGVIGIGGSPLSIWLLNVINWLSSRHKYVFDKTPHPLSKSPLEAKENASFVRDRVGKAVSAVSDKAEQLMRMPEDVEYEAKMDTDIASVVIDTDRNKERSDGSILHYYFQSEELDDDTNIVIEDEKTVQIVIDEDEEASNLEFLRRELFGDAKEQEGNE